MDDQVRDMGLNGLTCMTGLIAGFGPVPVFLQKITNTNFKIGQASVDLSLQRYAHDAGVDLVRREGAIDILVRKCRWDELPSTGQLMHLRIFS